jgi:predicted nucleic acid-binding protein
MIASPDMQLMILLLKHNRFALLKESYEKIIIPTAYIAEITGGNFDAPLAEGWLEIYDPDFENMMNVDRIESKTGIKLSVCEESCIALANKNKSIVLTEDREISTIARFLNLEVEDISHIIIRAYKSKRISKEDCIRFLREVYSEVSPIIKRYINLEEQLTKSI